MPVWVESHTSDLDTLRQFIEEGTLRPIIDSEFSLEHIQGAYDQSKTGRSRGKVAIVIQSQSEA